MLHLPLVGAAPSTHSRICSPSHDVSALPSCPHLEAHPVFSILPLYKLFLGTLAGYESDWYFDPRMYGDRLNLPDLPVNVHHRPFPCFAPLCSEICKKRDTNSSPPSKKTSQEMLQRAVASYHREAAISLKTSSRLSRQLPRHTLGRGLLTATNPHLTTSTTLPLLTPHPPNLNRSKRSQFKLFSKVSMLSQIHLSPSVDYIFTKS